MLSKMIELARDRSLETWKKALPKAAQEEIEMLYVQLSNGLLHVVVEGYGKYSKQTIVRFAEDIAASSLASYR